MSSVKSPAGMSFVDTVKSITKAATNVIAEDSELFKDCNRNFRKDRCYRIGAEPFVCNVRPYFLALDIIFRAYLGAADKHAQGYAALSDFVKEQEVVAQSKVVVGTQPPPRGDGGIMYVYNVLAHESVLKIISEAKKIFEKSLSTDFGMTEGTEFADKIYARMGPLILEQFMNVVMSLRKSSNAMRPSAGYITGLFTVNTLNKIWVSINPLIERIRKIEPIFSGLDGMIKTIGDFVDLGSYPDEKLVIERVEKRIRKGKECDVVVVPDHIASLAYKVTDLHMSMDLFLYGWQEQLDAQSTDAAASEPVCKKPKQ
jgi:hypothetical protein